jgi:N6-adenosine-specific RNA methylase IME4
MDTDSICKIPVRSIVAQRALCFLYCTSSFLADGLRVLDAWGFNYKTSGVWVKASGDVDLPSKVVSEIYAASVTYEDSPKKFAKALREAIKAHGQIKTTIGMGHYLRQAHELILVGSRGGMTAHDRSISSVFHAPRGEHSVKPDIVLDAVERLVPDGPYLEMFARRPRQGWVSWGNDPEVTTL